MNRLLGMGGYDISIHALREEGDIQFSNLGVHLVGISIHALREEGDARHLGAAFALRISIHALREEGDPARISFLPRPPRFLSTPSVRRATTASCCALPSKPFLSTPSVRRATDGGPRNQLRH